MTTVEVLSDLRAQYSCFDESEEPVYLALSEAIEAVKVRRAFEPKLGNWLIRDGRVICSNCENVPYNKIEYDGTVVYHIPKIAEVMKYCPICGARMK